MAIADNLVPAHVASAVRQGERDFRAHAERFGCPLLTISSAVHSYADVEAQALILAAGALGAEEARVKSLITYGAHYLDDQLDRPDCGFTYEQMVSAGDVRELLRLHEPIDRLAHHLAASTVHPEAFWRGLERVRFGALIQLAPDARRQQDHLEAHQAFALLELEDDVRRDGSRQRPLLFWLTTKTVQEMWLSTEESCDLTEAELWNWVYAPGLYLHDIDEEAESGEAQFFEHEAPSEDEMSALVASAARHLERRMSTQRARRSARLLQLRLFLHSFEPLLSPRLHAVYRDLEEILARATEIDLQTVGPP